jgi:5-methylcytosine-specific restriction endonuclease McrA
MNTGGFKRAQFKKKANQRCAYCDKRLTMETATVDHVVPKSAGGYNKWKNYKLACGACNSRKGSMALGTFKAFLEIQAAN